MLVEVPMAVNMVERQARRSKEFELGAHLGAGLGPDPGHEGDACAGRHGPTAQVTVVANQVGNVGDGRGRGRVEQRQMQPDTKVRHTFGPRHSVGGGRACDHQAGAGEHALAMPLLHRLVDLEREAEVVGGDDKSGNGHRLGCAQA